MRPGEGFWPDPDEMRVLDGIDSRLKEILPPEEFDEVSARHPQMVSIQVPGQYLCSRYLFCLMSFRILTVYSLTVPMHNIKCIC